MSSFKDKTVLVTGGARGIGKLMGKAALEKGASQLVIWDINQENMDQTADELKGFGKVLCMQVDVSSGEAIQKAAQELKSNRISIDILFNNAGIVVGSHFWEHRHQDIDQTMAINSTALMHITLCFLPDMMQKNNGHIINIASAAGMLSNPKMSVYAASKWAVIGWSESLRLELKEKKSNVKVTTITPSYINTGMFDGVKTHWILPIIKPETASRKIIKAVEKNKKFLRMPWSVYLLPFLKGMLPVSWFDLFVGNWLGVYKSMQHFKGHGK